MKKLLLLLLIVVPVLEIAVFILVGNAIGILPTILLIVLTSVLGAALAKKEGLNAIRTAQMQVSQGQMPGAMLLDGICIFIGGIVLIAPGFITDVLGFLLLIPQTRSVFKAFLQKMLQKAMNSGNVVFIAGNPWNRKR